MLRFAQHDDLRPVATMTVADPRKRVRTPALPDDPYFAGVSTFALISSVALFTAASSISR